MSFFPRIRILPLFAALSGLCVACGAPAGDETASGNGMSGAMAEDMADFVTPPWGVTGTPADDVTDPALMGLQNPNPTVRTNFGPLPGGREWGSSAGVDIGPDGHVWIYDRCGAFGLGDGGCGTSDVDPILKFDRNTGALLASFGGGELVTPHGLDVDAEGNVWITDFSANEEGTKGHQVLKFSPSGEVLMRLGVAGQPGNDHEHFNQPTDVIVAPNGDIFVADGHNGQNESPHPPGSTGRIMKFTPGGEFIKEWGRIGNKPGEFRTPHAMAFDSRGRLYVADRGNHRIQIFDQEGDLQDVYYQYSRVSDLFISDDDMLYAIDSETSDVRHPNWMTGVRIGSAFEDRVTAFIPGHPVEGQTWGAAGEGVAVDADGNVYAAEGPISRRVLDGGLTKYVKGM